MAKLRSIFLACAFIACHAGLASAADLGPYEPPVIDVPAPAPVPVCCGSAWYLRAFMGMTNQSADEIVPGEFAVSGDEYDIIDQGFDSSPLFGLGIGYDAGHYVRFDLTGEWRGGASFAGKDRYNNDGDPEFDATNEYTAVKKEWLFLANAYVDLGNWHGFTPYFGGGIGWAKVKLEDFNDINLVTHGVAFSESNSELNFAWALHAGVAYDVTPNVTIDLGYRYVDLGDASSGRLVAYDGSDTFAPVEMEDLHSHDLMMGVRWRFGGGQCCEIPPFK